MATYNGARFLAPQLDSIRLQSQPPAELVASDDGSSDDTVRILRDFADSVDFSVRILKQQSRLGVAANFARAFDSCQEEIVVPSDQDDVWHTEKLALLTQPFASPEVMLTFSDLLIGDSAAIPVGRTQWQALAFGPARRRAFAENAVGFLVGRNVVTGCAMAFRRSLVATSLPIPEGWLHDEWLALMAAIEGRIVPVDLPLVTYRQHSEQQVGQGIHGLRAQMRYARAHLTDDYMRLQVQRSQSASQAIARRLQSPRASDAMRLLDERAAHYRRRVHPNPASIVTDWRRGNYRRFSYGWKGALQDSVLRPVDAALKRW